MTINVKLINRGNFFASLGPEERPWQANYLAMYSSWLNGVVTDPALMLVPADDHLIHRGDGVFDVIRCVNGRIYQMEAHLKRLESSASAISLKFPREYDQIRDIIKSLVLIGGEKECIIRIIISRGPGGFSTNPFECPASQLYIIIVGYNKVPDVDYREGIGLALSRVPAKESFFASIKSCNYLPNVLMKMEAINGGYEFSVNIDDDGFVGEGSTENIGIVSKDGYIKIPPLENTLAGTTVMRVMDLADILVKDKTIKGVCFENISPADIRFSSEVMLMGTSINILPVVNFEGELIGTGSPGHVCSILSDLLRKDMYENTDLLTEIEWES
jgi:branched-subunit amino acid aminotransferase/4-amino-4-deoxychorismate lyase